jgi:hypothetical protein
MIQLTPQMKILVAVEAVDGRKGIDSLARLCAEKLAADPFSGWEFIFARAAWDARTGLFNFGHREAARGTAHRAFLYRPATRGVRTWRTYSGGGLLNWRRRFRCVMQRHLND